MHTDSRTGHLGPLVRYFLRLGFLGFGGPVALVGQIGRELVGERYGWLGQRDFLIAVAVGMISPGPVAIGLASLAALFRWKVSNPLVMATCAAVGLIAFPLMHPTWVLVR